MLGLSRSRILPLPGEGAELMFLGGSLLSRFLENWYFPEIPFGHDIFLHPAAFAGWAGFYVTALNLVPLGQLDGGHIAYGLFGDTWNRVAPWVGYALVVMGVLVYPAWLVIALLVRFTMGWTHPDLMTDGRARGVDAAIGWVTVMVLVLTFMPSVILDADAPTIVQRLQLLFGTAE
jgi:membrane-associated protease RseP (regulator of RpoE activity)